MQRAETVTTTEPPRSDLLLFNGLADSLRTGANTSFPRRTTK